jgi:hypothetical protein
VQSDMTNFADKNIERKKWDCLIYWQFSCFIKKIYLLVI